MTHPEFIVHGDPRAIAQGCLCKGTWFFRTDCPYRPVGEPPKPTINFPASAFAVPQNTATDA